MDVHVCYLHVRRCMYVHVHPCTSMYMCNTRTPSVQDGSSLSHPAYHHTQMALGAAFFSAIMPPCHPLLCTSANICKVSEYSLAHTASTDPSPCSFTVWLHLTVQHLHPHTSTEYLYVQDVQYCTYMTYQYVSPPNIAISPRRGKNLKTIRMPKSAPAKFACLGLSGGAVSIGAPKWLEECFSLTVSAGNPNQATCLACSTRCQGNNPKSLLFWHGQPPSALVLMAALSPCLTFFIDCSFSPRRDSGFFIACKALRPMHVTCPPTIRFSPLDSPPLLSCLRPTLSR